MKKELGLSLIETSVAIMLITIVFTFGWNVYTSSENYVSYRLAANQITKLMSDTCNFIEKVHSINKFNLNEKNCIAPLSKSFLRENGVIGEDYNQTTDVYQKLNVYVRIPNCTYKDFNMNRFNYEVLVTAKGNLSKYSLSLMLVIMKIFGAIQQGNSNTYIGLFQRNILNLDDWGIKDEAIGLIGYKFKLYEKSKGVRIEQISLIPYENNEPIKLSDNVWQPNSNDKLVILWSGVNMRKSKLVMRLNKNDKNILTDSVQVLTDSAMNKYTFFFPRNWLSTIRKNVMYNLEIEIQGEGGGSENLPSKTNKINFELNDSIS